jgi:hypothetical protein
LKRTEKVTIFFCFLFCKEFCTDGSGIVNSENGTISY